MDPADLLFARLALARRWISREVYEQTLSRVERLQALGFHKTVEDVLREGGNLDESRLRVLRRLLSHQTHQARVGDYLLVRQIGTGGTGLVFEGCHRRIGRRVALKILFPRLEKEQGFAERFLREATVLARINHPNVVHAYDAGQDGDFYYIAMEMVEGYDLRRILKESGPLSISSFVEIATAVSLGLQAIHDAGLLHRDIKPANVLVSSDQSSRTVKLVDFGLVFGDDSSTRSASSASGLVLGTPEYMSPEQISGDALADARSDLYSLGATFYHMLSGRVPFSRATPRETLRAHLEEAPDSLAALRPDVPPAIVSLVEVLMAREKAARPDSARTVARMLEELGGSDPKAGLPTSELGGTRRLNTGTRRLAWIAAMAAVFLGGLGLGLLQTLPDRTRAVRDVEPIVATLATEEREVREAVSLPVESGATADDSRIDGTADPGAQWDRLVEAGREMGDTLARSWPPDWNDRVPFSRLITRFWRSGAADPTATDLAAVGAGLEVSMPLADWIVASGQLVRERFRRRMARVDQDQTIRALLRGPDRLIKRRVWVEDTLAGLTFVDVELDRRYALADAHPLMVLEWGGLARVSNEDLVQLVGYLVGADQIDVAARLVDELRIRLSDEQAAVLRDATAIADQADDDVALPYFEEILDAARLRRQGELGLQNSLWTVAVVAYRGLLELGDVPDSLVGETDTWEARLERAGSLKWLTTGVFHGRAHAIDALVSEVLRVEYVWDDEAELRDFRARSGGWVLRYGELATAGPSIELIDTIAFFQLPVRVEVRWSVSEDLRLRGDGVRVTAFFDQIGLGVGGRDDDLQIVGLGSDEDRLFLSEEATSGADSLTVEWTADRIIASTGGGHRIDTSHPLPVPSFGRVGLRVDAGGLIESLSIQGELQPVWAQARRAFLERNQR